MHRLLVALLAALDAVIAAASGVATVLAPLTLLWVFGFAGPADWAALWPVGGSIWQLGHLVSLDVTLPDLYLANAGIDPAAASFTLSLAPLALAVFTAMFAARSGRRAAEAGAAVTGAVVGVLVFAVLSFVIALTTANALAVAQPWQAVLLPSLVFAVPLIFGALLTAWRLDDRGPIAGLRERVERLPGAWSVFPSLFVRGAGLVMAGLLGVGALVAGAGVILRSVQIVALFEASHVDVTGVVVLSIAQLAYLPTLMAWGLAYAAGPGFAIGTSTAVSPAGTQLGLVPGIPLLGAVPESSTSWLLLLALLPFAVGVLAGWMLRSRLAALGGSFSRHAGPDEDGGWGIRLALLGSLAVVAGGFAALVSAMASGSLGPGRLAEVGPEPGPVALSVGVEVLVGAAILLLLPRGRGVLGASLD